jgi:cyclic beta-1,2-glucan synthetase
LLLVGIAVSARQGGAVSGLFAAACTTLGLAGLAPPGYAFAAAARAALPTGLMAGLLALSADPTLRVWQAPGVWLDLVRLSGLGAGLAMTLLLAGAVWAITRRGRFPYLSHGAALLALPYLFGAFFVLASPHLASELGRAIGLGLALPPPLQLGLGRTAILFLLNEVIVVGLGWLMDHRWSRDGRLHLLLLASAATAALSPHLATLGTVAGAAGLPWIVRTALLTLLAAGALAGLWAQTFLLTGVMLDGLHQRRPTYELSARHWREGGAKGGIYSGLFILLVQLLAATIADPTLRLLHGTAPIAVAAVAGAVLYPLGRTIIESFDGSAPFLQRLVRNATERTGYFRGVVIGAAIGGALWIGLPDQGSYHRFLYGFAFGALAYAGIDLLKDGWFIHRGPRLRLQTWRLYAMDVLLGGIVGGAVAWYCDTAQLAAITAKFQAYAAVHYPLIGRASETYVIYPLFSKWGATNLGLVEGGVRLLYNESLSGVINWSLAAPLFSVNLVFLTALLQRSLHPIRSLMSARGLVGLVEQAIRVLRWGLWMAPVIYSFLRMAPDPTWYNQDGAVRTAVATFQSWTLSPPDFRAWSLEVFLGLLAYDWFRVLIWFDHMGLRVATLVNLSFIGGDRLDEGAARALGHSGRTHAIPEGLRRFATWAPLLIPFYIPRGAEWDRVWVAAEQMQASAPSLLPSVQTVLTGYAVAALVALALTLLLWFRDQPVRVRPATEGAVPPPEPPWSPLHVFHVGNGFYTLDVCADGRCHSHTLRTGGHGPEIDLTRRSDERMMLTGKFFYLRDLAHGERAEGPFWSLGWQPIRHAGPDYGVSRLTPTNVRFVNSRDGLRAEALVEVAEAEAHERWRLRLTNDSAQERMVELVSYQELALAPWDGYRRTPSYNAVHVGTCFVRSLGALIARNRHLKPKQGVGGAYPFAREVAFHAVAGVGGADVQLAGYQDVRPCFIGSGTLAAPEGLHNGRFRSPADEGLLYGFDPVASLRLLVKVPAGGTAEVAFVDGYAADEQAAARTIAARLDLPPPEPAALTSLFARSRTLDASLRTAPATEPPYQFSPDGTELRLTGTTPRPWHHVLANPLGHGAVVGNDGEIFSFAGNAQQNGLTACNLDTVPAQVPAQLFYVVDLDGGRIDTPTFVPHRRCDAVHEVVYGRGYAVFKKRTPELEMELTAFVPPDEPVELRLLTLRNRLGRTARYRVVPYLEMALAELPRDSIDHLTVRAAPGALFFCNPGNQFQGGWAFVATSLDCTHQETVRRHFLGAPEHDWSNPHLVVSGTSDATQLDDGRRIASFVGVLELEPGASATISVALGQVAGLEEAAAMAETYRTLEVAERALVETKRFWADRLNLLRVETNRPAFDRLVNDWLPYQVLVARLWGRTGPNQRGGAFGFRDQLQDVLPLLFVEPELARRQILLHARQQFVEGDVLQWWHRSREGRTGLGARNRASDPHLWLPYLVVRYVAATGDRSILAEEVPFLEGKRLPRHVEGVVQMPRPSRDSASLYQHCQRAIHFTLARMGPNGLPLIGTGDWNDGLSDVGRRGRGESVWLACFLHDVLTGFADLAAMHESEAAAAPYRDHAERLRRRIELMWRGDRYVRAITDEGQELAWRSALMGSWPTLSGAVDFRRGMAALEGALIALEQESQVLVLTPPFGEDSPLVPGKIADYPPGVRENGGQYSHGSSWLVDAATRLTEAAHEVGDEAAAARLRDRAFELWCKISPLGKTGPDRLDVYGLPPHQQPADIYFGPGYAGRGGWSWYTGAAARMLTAAYGMLGLRMHHGKLELSPEVAREGPVRVRRVVHRGRVLAAKHEPALPVE